MRRFRSLADLVLAALCLWAAWYHTPAGALLRIVGSRIVGMRTSARPLLAYYSAGTQGGRALPDLPAPRALLAPGAALGYGVAAVLGQLDSRARGEVLQRAGARDATPEAVAAAVAQLADHTDSKEAAVLSLFCGAEAVRYAQARSASNDLADLARQLPPSYEDGVAHAAQALTLGTAYALAWPLPDWARVTSPFGVREHPLSGGRRFHAGVDLGAPIGTPVRAVAAGIVRRASADAANGRTLVIDHGSGVTTVYCHNDALLVSAGDRVEKGQMVSRSGNSGHSTGPHLHYQLDLPDGPADPFRFRVVRPVHVAEGGVD
jgi:murein DD-endopeptidase MepM/ murein hydrolase activator NlpD